MNRSLLLVEDDYYIRDVYVSGIAKENGYEIDTAENGTVALQKLSSKKYDFILLDIMLPDLTGIEILKKLKASDGPNKSTPLYMFTNAAKDELINEAFSLGADGFLVKVEHTPKDVKNEIESFFANSAGSTTPPQSSIS